MDRFTAGMDQFLVILQLLIREHKQALLVAKQKASPLPHFINLEKQPKKHENWHILETEHANKDYNQLKAKN